MMVMPYILCGGQIYKRSYDGIHLCCLKKEEAKRIMEEVHQGICGPHTDVSKEDFENEILLEYDGNRLCGLCEKLP